MTNGAVEDTDQPEDDGKKGELVIGPGAGGIQPRASECKRVLPALTLEQEERLKRAKRFAMEQSVQQVHLLKKICQYVFIDNLATSKFHLHVSAL